VKDSRSLPPLPTKYRQSPRDTGIEEYGFRWGAFLASLACLAVGLGMCLGAETTNPLWYGFAAVLIAAFVLSAWGSRLWSDKPVDGLRRLAANAQVALLTIFLVAIAAGLAYVLTLVLFRLASESLLMMVMVVVAFLCLGLTFRGTAASSLMRNSISWAFFPHSGPPHAVAHEEEALATTNEAMRALREEISANGWNNSTHL
jgi:hypothetical protein